MTMPTYLSAGGAHSVHVGQLIGFLCQRASWLGIAVVPSVSEAPGYDVVLRLGGPYHDRLAAESTASLYRNLTNLPAVSPAAPATDPARTTDIKEHDHA